MTELSDFAGALRQMADNVDALTNRHDVTQMARLRREADEHAAQAQRIAGDRCSRYIPDSWTCRTEGTGKTRGAKAGRRMVR